MSSTSETTSSPIVEVGNRHNMEEDDVAYAPDDPVYPFKRIARRLYLSHALSTWNSRTFEFGAILFLAEIFPGTLFYASFYALVRALSATIFSAWVGGLVDKSHRLKAIRHSIIWQRIPVAISCGVFLVFTRVQSSSSISYLLFAALVLLACPEKLASIANTVAVERDWVVVISQGNNSRRQDLNSAMRRIDLFSKLVAPVFISSIDIFSATLAIWVVLSLNTTSVILEYLAIDQVYRAVPDLVRSAMPIQPTDTTHGDEELASFNMAMEATEHSTGRQRNSLASRIHKIISPYQEYVSSPVLLASLSLSILYLTVLSFGAQMVTYMLSVGFTASQISFVRMLSVAVELSATWAAPLLMRKIGAVRSGLWFINWQLGCTFAAVAVFWTFGSTSRIAGVGLVAGVVTSRVGLWGFDLCVQYLIQEEIPPTSRGRYSATEMALQNLFELLSFATTMIFARPEQFKYPVLMSAGAVTAASLCFTTYVKKNRGHLFHRSRCLGKEKYAEVPHDEPL